MVSRFSPMLGLLGMVLGAGSALAAGGAPLQVIVSKDQQSLVVYDGDTVVATSNVSTGKRGHETPTGIFSILEKRKFHASNIYSNAPMPFMQRLTWSGIALHGARHVPPRPASHGCVRLPESFAKSLFSMTGRGLHVIIAGDQLVPRLVDEPALFQPTPPTPQLLTDATLRPSMDHPPGTAVEVAMSTPAPAQDAGIEADDRAPIRILITRRGPREHMLDLQGALSDLGFYTGPLDGAAGSQTAEAIRAFERAERLPETGRDGPSVSQAIFAKTKRPPPPNGQLLVRRDFAPLFEVPVTIADPTVALGVHFFQFQDRDPDSGKGKWFALSLDNALPGPMRKRLGITVQADSHADGAAEASLKRIAIPEEARRRIEALLADGSSLTISDLGLGQETGRGTDFVTVTQERKG
ncbi:L,D-transpeptidase family protein [Rhizobium sp. CC-YZS058]|uniref:L,D-transpeptidase family protein n=1 Tax=Rhizobium sp. CC-YZS058 TaxID=3042153 RepID=UPI002B054D52|nr:L,D-transpeptidase family protein [Rhizobium sp. CC-YZS058]MEA3535219.1 L,D-transpeptidase family protein [Rhizobium sp. CC-YZS058]